MDEEKFWVKKNWVKKNFEKKKKIGNKSCLKLPELPRNHISLHWGGCHRQHCRVTCRVAHCEQQGMTKNNSRVVPIHCPGSTGYLFPQVESNTFSSFSTRTPIHFLEGKEERATMEFLKISSSFWVFSQLCHRCH